MSPRIPAMLAAALVGSCSPTHDTGNATGAVRVPVSTADAAPGADALPQASTVPATTTTSAPLRRDDAAAASRDVSRTKFEAGLTRHFARFDANSDGAITRAEWPTARARRFGRFDADGDGRITASEFRTVSLAGFDRRDRNHDGILEPDERGPRARGPAAHGATPDPDAAEE